MRRSLAALALPALLLTGCGGDDTSSLLESAPVTTTSTTTSSPTTTTPAPTTTTPAPVEPEPTQAAPAAAVCDAPPAELVAEINDGFLEDSYELTQAQSLTAASGVVYVGGNMTDTADASRASSADVWAYFGGTMYSLSGTARDETSLPDGRDALGLSAGDDDGIALQDCIIALGYS